MIFILNCLKELRLIFPNSQRLNRGNYVMSQLVQACRANEVTDLILVHEHRGEPGMKMYNYCFITVNMGYWPSIRSRCQDIDKVPFCRWLGP